MVLDLVGQLYAVEREVPSLPVVGDSERGREEILALRGRLRAERPRRWSTRFKTWALAQQALPESGWGRLVSYLRGLWKGLTRFLNDPQISLDDNVTERGLRGVVLRRKDHYGSRSRRGTVVAALFYSLIESAKLSDVEPKRYLLTATCGALTDPTAVTLPRDLVA